MTAPDHAKQGWVLLVDDQLPLIQLFADALAPFFDTDLATSTKEALQLMQRKPYKVVVCDHLMPGGNGLDFLLHIRQAYPDTQRILLTGYLKPQQLLPVVTEAELFRYLLKPVSLPELLRSVQDAAKLHDQGGGGPASSRPGTAVAKPRRSLLDRFRGRRGDALFGYARLHWRETFDLGAGAGSRF
ncbi:MAG: response regulator [Opitutales bacterium]